MNKYEMVILKNLLKSGYALDQKEFLDTISSRDRPHILKAIKRLEAKLLVVQGCYDQNVIMLPRAKIKEALRTVSPFGSADHSQTPMEELIPKKYSAPFLIKEGEKKIHGKVSRYAFCRSLKDKHNVTCFVVNHKGTIRAIQLGSVFNPASMISEFLKEIDEKFTTKFFIREDLKMSLSRKLIQNNQPTKAVIEYLCYEKFLIRYDNFNGRSKFQRTGKPHPITPIDEMISLQDSKPSHMNFNGGRYAYHESDGLYPVLY